MTSVRWAVADAAAVVRAPRATDDKYRRGVLGVRTGSDAYPGAAVLGVEGAWRTGLGMVHYVGGPGATSLVLQRRPETVPGAGRVQAWLIGSGTDAAARTDVEAAALRDIVAGALPVVADAGALDLAVGARAPVVVTPHAREHDRLRALLDLDPVPSDAVLDERVAAATETARAAGVVVLLKGAETVVADPGGWTRIVDAGSPWLATAGTGDVLGGTLGALAAAAAAAHEASTPGIPLPVEALGLVAATAAWLHGTAARLASDAVGGGPITALDVAGALPRAVAAALAAQGTAHTDALADS